MKKKQVITQLKHPYLIWTDYQPFNTQEIPLPKGIGMATFTEQEAKKWTAKVKESKWEHKIVVLSGGGGADATLFELKEVFPTPQYHYLGDDKKEWSKKCWNIVAILMAFSKEDSPWMETIFTPSLGSWQIRLYLEDGKPVYADDFKKRIEEIK